MIGTRKFYRVSWYEIDKEFQEKEFENREAAIAFSIQIISRGVEFVSIGDVVVDFDEDGDFGECEIEILSYSVD